jgi:ribosomal-protein-alanine N-acetyltransferase
VRYRLYQPSDFAELYAIEEECFQPPIRFGRRYMRTLLNSPNSAAWMAEEEGRIAGFAIVDFTAGREGTIGYIQTIEVAPAYRRRGVATGLLDQVEDSSRHFEAVAVWLHVDSTNDSAIRLYRAHGYVKQGTQNHYYARGRAADIYVKILRDLPAEPAS